LSKIACVCDGDYGPPEDAPIAHTTQHPIQIKTSPAMIKPKPKKRKMTIRINHPKFFGLLWQSFSGLKYCMYPMMIHAIAKYRQMTNDTPIQVRIHIGEQPRLMKNQAKICAKAESKKIPK
jgi:hypothetical protein